MTNLKEHQLWYLDYIIYQCGLKFHENDVQFGDYIRFSCIMRLCWKGIESGFIVKILSNKGKKYFVFAKNGWECKSLTLNHATKLKLIIQHSCDKSTKVLRYVYKKGGWRCFFVYCEQNQQHCNTDKTLSIGVLSKQMWWNICFWFMNIFN